MGVEGESSLLKSRAVRAATVVAFVSGVGLVLTETQRKRVVKIQQVEPSKPVVEEVDTGEAGVVILKGESNFIKKPWTHIFGDT